MSPEGSTVQQIAEVDRLGRQLPASGEGEQLVAQLGAAPRGAKHGVDDLTVVALTGEDFHVAVNDRQEIVEIVRYAAGQLADGVQLLRLVQLLLELPALGDVAKNDDCGRTVVEVDA